MPGRRTLARPAGRRLSPGIVFRERRLRCRHRGLSSINIRRPTSQGRESSGQFAIATSYISMISTSYLSMIDFSREHGRDRVATRRGGGMRITERRKGLVHISLYDGGLPSVRWRGPTAFEGHGCRRSVTPSDGFMSLLGDRSNVLAGDLNHDLARQGWSTRRAKYAQQILGPAPRPRRTPNDGLSDLALAGGCCGMIPPLVGISGSDLWLQ